MMDDQNVVQEAVDALTLIGAWGLHESKRPEAWVLGVRAQRVLKGEPMTEDEIAEFTKKVNAHFG